MFFLLFSMVRAAVYYSVEEITENSTLVVEAEVVASSCLTYSINDQGVEDILYEATLSISSMSKGDITDTEVTLYSNSIIYPPDGPELSCSWSDSAHPVGEKGTYYLISNDSGYELHMYGFTPSEDSNPSDNPECPVPEEPSDEIPNEPSDTTIEDTGSEEKTGCSNVNSSPLSALIVIFVMGFIRRRQ